MSIVAFPERFENYIEALKANSVIKTNSSIDGVDNLFNDMSSTGYYDSDDICAMFLKVLPEPYVVGAFADIDKGVYFVSNRLINMLLDEIGDQRSEYGQFHSVVQAFVGESLGVDARAELGNQLDQHLFLVTQPLNTRSFV